MFLGLLKHLISRFYPRVIRTVQEAPNVLRFLKESLIMKSIFPLRVEFEGRVGLHAKNALGPMNSKQLTLRFSSGLVAWPGGSKGDQRALVNIAA